MLFLCTGNSARSIMAEALLNQWGKGEFKAYSAGSRPKGKVHPLALETLSRNGFRLEIYRSKSWDEFAGKNAPVMDFVFTVCNNAADETCPIWPGQPITAHWGVADPDRPALPVKEQAALFTKVFRELDQRVKVFTALPIEKLERVSLQKHLNEIGNLPPA